MPYVYYMTHRPPMPGAMPKDGLLEIEAREPWKHVPHAGRAYAKLTYSRPLTEKELYDYELAAEPSEVKGE